MQKQILLILLLFLTSCDAPRTQRAVYNEIGSSESSSESYTPSSPNFTYPSNSTDHILVPSQASHCNWSMDRVNNFEQFSSHLSGRFNICQNQTIDTNIYFQVQNLNYDNRICFIPLHSPNGSYSSIYLGTPQCIFAKSNDISSIKLQKNRMYYGKYLYSQYKVTGVMIIQDKSYSFPYPYNIEMNAVEAYIRCMDNLQNDGGAHCNAFKSVGEYTLHNF